MAKIGIIMGSNSDRPVMQHAAQFLQQFGVAYEARVVSAHRKCTRFNGLNMPKPHENEVFKPLLQVRVGRTLTRDGRCQNHQKPVLVCLCPANICVAKILYYLLCKCPKACLWQHLLLAKPVPPMPPYLLSPYSPTTMPNWHKNSPISVPHKNKPCWQ